MHFGRQAHEAGQHGRAKARRLAAKEMRPVGIGEGGDILDVALVFLLFLFQLGAIGVACRGCCRWWNCRRTAVLGGVGAAMQCGTVRSVDSVDVVPEVLVSPESSRKPVLVEASPPLCSVGRSGSGLRGSCAGGAGVAELEPELPPVLPVEASPLLCSVGRSGSGGGPCWPESDPVLLPPLPPRNLRDDACGAGWARRFAHRRLRRSSPLAPARAWAWAAASTCRILPMLPAPGRHFRCRRGLRACRPAGADTRPRLPGQAVRAGQDRFPVLKFLPVVDADGHNAAGLGMVLVARPLQHGNGAQRGRVLICVGDLAGILRCAPGEQRPARSNQHRCRYPQASWALR